MPYTVKQRARSMKQPRGGYINPRKMEQVSLGDGMEALNSEENVHVSLVSTAVDYLTRYMSGTGVGKAFEISYAGAKIINEAHKALMLESKIHGLDDTSVACAIKLTGYDVCFRASTLSYKPVDDINPDKATIENVRIMVKRSLRFLQLYGPKTMDGFTFEGGYTDTVVAGDGDFLTKDTLWDFKVSKMPIKSWQTLQILMYWRMGLRSIHSEFKSIKYLGIYNPRTNIVYRMTVENIPQEVLDEVDRIVIGYE